MPIRQTALAVGALALVVGAATMLVRGADHGDAPGVRVNSRLDINDVYAFRSPADPSHAVLIMTVSPLAGITGATTFHPQGNYDFNIDANGDAVADDTFRVTFSAPDAHGDQEVRVTSDHGRPAVEARGLTGQNIALAGGGALRAGLFDDPFFFDLLAFRNGLAFCPGGTGVDFFRGLNTLAIVLEVPAATLGGPNVGVWARTSQGGRTIDRMGRPAINTVFIPKDLKDAFNTGDPVNDWQDFGAIVTAKLQTLGAADPSGLAHFLLPDVLTVNTSDPSGFPNGRGLSDDVIDIELGLITNGAVTSDCVANDSAFVGTFPYLAPANP
jgi:Domain of unknown function (DUF4331)